MPGNIEEKGSFSGSIMKLASVATRSITVSPATALRGLGLRDSDDVDGDRIELGRIPYVSNSNPNPFKRAALGLE